MTYTEFPRWGGVLDSLFLGWGLLSHTLVRISGVNKILLNVGKLMILLTLETFL